MGKLVSLEKTFGEILSTCIILKLCQVLPGSAIKRCVNIMSSSTDDTSRYKPGNTAN